MTFHGLHNGVLPLLLPNAWDVPSALAFIDCGFSAIGTTSLGVASCQGSPDGDRSTKTANLALTWAVADLQDRLVRYAGGNPPVATGPQ